MRSLATMMIAVLVLSGCAATGPGPETTADPVKPPATTATRTLPATFTPGAAVTVRLRVVPAPETKAVIVTETLPAGWTVLKAAPAVAKQHEGNAYKWIRVDVPPRPISAFDIVYEAQSPLEPGAGEQKFAGTVHTYREGTLATVGAEVTTARAPK